MLWLRKKESWNKEIMKFVKNLIKVSHLRDNILWMSQQMAVLFRLKTGMILF